MKLTSFMAGIALLLSGPLAQRISADPVTIAFSGVTTEFKLTISPPEGPSGPLAGLDVPIGTPFSGTVSYFAHNSASADPPPLCEISIGDLGIYGKPAGWTFDDLPLFANPEVGTDPGRFWGKPMDFTYNGFTTVYGPGGALNLSLSVGGIVSDSAISAFNVTNPDEHQEYLVSWKGLITSVSRVPDSGGSALLMAAACLAILTRKRTASE